MLLFEALEVRKEYRRKYRALESLLNNDEPSLGFRQRETADKYRYTDAFSEKREEIQEKVKTLRYKEARLNEQIQLANLNNEITVEDETITLASALEKRKQLDNSISELKDKLNESRREGIIYKEDRNIVIDPDHDFNNVFAEYLESVEQYRRLQVAIHEANHSIEVDWQYEE